MARKILVLGGTRYFGKHLIRNLLENGDEVAIGTRGLAQDDFGSRVRRYILDRTSKASMVSALGGTEWDLVYDQFCYAPNDALIAKQLFKNKVGKYIFTSTQSVYSELEGELKESDVDTAVHPIRLGTKNDMPYSEAKRSSEAILFQNPEFPVIAMRIPIVLGPDDYTGRLEFHLDHVRQGKPIVLENPSSKMSAIHSTDAGKFLFWLGSEPALRDFTGPINAASPDPMEFSEIIAEIEKQLGKKAQIVPTGRDEDRTPFVSPESAWLNTTKATTLGYRFQLMHQWLPTLIRELLH